jgi:hypothetical protein
MAFQRHWKHSNVLAERNFKASRGTAAPSGDRESL